jgi:sulfur carrier protein ThiS
LKLAGAQALNFLNVVLNGQPLRLFNLGSLTVGDALLAAGIDARSLAGRPGLGLTLNINGERRFLPGSHGDPGQLTVNGKKVSFGESIAEGDVLLVDKGKNGATPKPRLKELVELPPPVSVTIQHKKYSVGPLIVLGDKIIGGEELLHDRDEVVWKPADTIDRVLRSAQVEYEPRRFTYTLNGVERTHATWPGFLLNDQPADGSFIVRADDSIELVPPPVPSIAEVINFKPEDVAPVDVIFNGVACSVPSRRFSLTLNGAPASLSDPAPDSAVIEFNLSDQSFPTLADVLLAAEFNPRDIPANQSVSIALNGKVSEFTTKVKNGDKIDVVVKDLTSKGK